MNRTLWGENQESSEVEKTKKNFLEVIFEREEEKRSKGETRKG